GFAAIDVRQADIHDDQIDLSRLGSLNAFIAVFSSDGFILLVQRKLLRQRATQFGIIVDNENLTRIRHHFRPLQPLAPMRLVVTRQVEQYELSGPAAIFPPIPAYSLRPSILLGPILKTRSANPEELRGLTSDAVTSTTPDGSNFGLSLRTPFEP